MTNYSEQIKNSQESNGQATSDVPYGSMEIRLSAKEWILCAIIVITVLGFLPMVWKSAEEFDPRSDYRIPHDVSTDYWIYERLMEQTKQNDKIPIIGDSVIWGEYVRPGESLAGELNQQAGSDPFINAGLSGAHPLAIEGLVRYYSSDLKDSKIVLHCNLLWSSSAKYDLQDEKKIYFNHPNLIAQFSRNIPAYRSAKVSDRLSIVFDRHMPFRTLVHHIRATSFNNQDIPFWTLENPYKNVLSQLSLRIPRPKTKLRHRPISWVERRVHEQDMPWVDLQSSLQWQAFRNTVELLVSRNNQVFVLVGPLNEHLLTDASRQRYRSLKQEATQWLENQNIPHLVLEPLPSDHYADASHPLNVGYAYWAAQILAEPTFHPWGRTSVDKETP